jgi:hypothetical protein
VSDERDPFRQELNRCKIIVDKREKAECLFQLLTKVTSLQDEIQLEIPYLNPSMSSSLGIINNANAIILEASRQKGNIEKEIDMGYLKEKVEYLINNFNDITQKYNLVTIGASKPRISCEEVSVEPYPSDLIEKERKRILKDQI